MFRPGCIRKVEAKNFVTYSHVEFQPGPKLNMIIGPNGTGKSTIVAAIILALGGNPKIVGRGSKVSEYVKHGCDVATINLFLETNDRGQYLKVTREFDTNDRNSWKLNNRKVNVKEVMQQIEQYKIQVNNLCQFLPQDRVQEFAKLNKQELLRDTQKALCRFDLIEKQDFLVKSREQQKQLLETISNCQKKLQECKDLNTRLEGRVYNFRKKKTYTEKLQDIERKISWMMYERKHDEVRKVKEDRTKAQQVYDTYKEDMKPAEGEIVKSKREIMSMQQESDKIFRQICNIETNINGSLEKIGTTEQNLRNLNDEMEAKLAEIGQWDREIDITRNKLQEMNNLKYECEAKYNEHQHLKQSLSMERDKLIKLKGKHQERKDDISQKRQDDTLRIRALESETRRLENVKQMRLQRLEKLSPDAHKATTWIKNNKHLFEGEIYEPMMIEINVLETKHARYIENVIALRDKIAFTCTVKSDMNKLIRYLREEQKLSVNVVHSSDEEGLQYKPNVPIERLRKYGFYTYMNNLFTAPVPIMNYLCKTYKLHNIPLGDKTTDNQFEDAPAEIGRFFSEKYSYSVSVSKYSGEKSVRQVEVRSDGSLSSSLDVVKLNQLKGQIAEAQRKINGYNSQEEAVDKQIKQLTEQINDTWNRTNEIQREKHNLDKITMEVKNCQKKLDGMVESKKSPDDVKNDFYKEKKRLMKSIPEAHSAIKREADNLLQQEKNKVLTLRKIEEARKNINYYEQDLNEKKRQCQEAEETLTRVKDRLNELMEEAKAMLQKAKSLSKGFVPTDSGFEQFRKRYYALSKDLEELTIQREQIQSQIACLNVADDGEMSEYEERVKEIDRLKEELETEETNLNKITTKMERWEREWLEPLKELVAEINVNFARAFEKLNCAGEVSVCTGDNDKDFAQYGISIKVTYRSGEPLQELNSTTQSGGERAVATAAYMLSLQKLTPVPFRCVDEINQGMDANNERRIFELVVEGTCQEASPQYFLITPKLIPNLKYSPHMTIHIVHNGPFVTQDRKWSFAKICNPQKIHIT